MSKSSEYTKLATEIANHQEYSIRVMLYSIMVVGGIVGAKDEVTESSVIGAGFIGIASLVYLIGAARKIFVLSAFLAIEHDDSPGFNWHSVLPRLQKQFRAWFETQNIAIVYMLVAFGCLLIFLQVSPTYAIALFVIQILLAGTLFSIPKRAGSYQDKLRKLRDTPNYD